MLLPMQCRDFCSGTAFYFDCKEEMLQFRQRTKCEKVDSSYSKVQKIMNCLVSSRPEVANCRTVSEESDKDAQHDKYTKNLISSI